MKSKRGIKIAIFASGNGTNAESIAHYMSGNSSIEVVAIFSNNPKAGVIARAAQLGIVCHLFSKDDFYESNAVQLKLKTFEIDYIVLAGFLWLTPSSIINMFQGKILNIHPALLPKYGGKGMYGMKVHEAVIANKESFSGITIHLVDEKYDTGKIIFQAQCEIGEAETASSLAEKIHQLEYNYYPKIIHDYILASIA